MAQVETTELIAASHQQVAGVGIDQTVANNLLRFQIGSRGVRTTILQDADIQLVENIIHHQSAVIDAQPDVLRVALANAACGFGHFGFNACKLLIYKY